jgi:hypothetical protein
MLADRQEIADDLSEIVRSCHSGPVWHGVEARCSVPCAEFPEGMNVKHVLDEARETGMLTKRKVNGKDWQLVPSPNLSSRAP